MSNDTIAPATLAKTRQVTLKETGGNAYGKAQRIAFALRTLGYKAEQGYVASPAGSWADTVYVMTDAPIAKFRRAEATA